MHVLLIDDQSTTAKVLRAELPPALEGLPATVAVVELPGRPDAAITNVAPGGDVREFYGAPEELTRHVAPADVLVVHKAPVTAAVLEAAPALKLVACARGNPVNVDLRAAASRGIPVVCAPGRAAESTADFTMALILALARHLVPACARVRELGPEAWRYAVRSALEGVELHGRILGLVGFGQVGRRVAARARAFGMTVLVCDPYVSGQVIRDAGAEPVPLEELLRRADFVSLHTPLSSETRGLIGARELALMRPAACLINTARGELVDEAALAQVLRAQKIKAAALDVLTAEPPAPNNPLLTLPNVLITPHLGGKTDAAPRRAAQTVIRDVRNFLLGRPLENPVRP
ncbi:MAG: NAD(P)-dependent oxidoreductase [Desulfotomaculales bacterium]